jgi:predicted secreted Zn-dependent protease
MTKSFKLSWRNDTTDEYPDGEVVLATDEEVMNYIMTNLSNVVPPEVYAAIESGLTEYSSNTDEQIAEMEDDTGMDSWDGMSLARWIDQDDMIDMTVELV